MEVGVLGCGVEVAVTRALLFVVFNHYSLYTPLGLGCPLVVVGISK